MDRKSIIILAAAIALLLAMSPLVDHFFPPKLVPITVTNQVSAVTNSVVGASPGLAETQTTPAAQAPGAPETFLTYSNAEVIYRFTSRGGGLKQIDLTQYRAVTRRSIEAKAPT